ncbi:transglutaminaseTgpA domain-containing protein [Lysobacter korlensis]|uniref:TransglutaminaseTgpA domain-containing protein n=1 Tax=Lysobacter korlensis TaxID=553636 RepID=A0ABV6RZT5_9GAMM
MTSHRTPGTRSARVPALGFTVVTTLLFWATMAAAAVALWPLYRDPSFVLLAAATILAGSAVAMGGAFTRASGGSVMVATLAVFLVLGVPLAVPSKAALGILPTVDGLLDLLAGVALGWKQLLTITLPVGNYQALLVPAFALLLTATVTGLSVGLRAKYGELGVIAPVLVFVLAVLFGPEEAVAPAALALALLATILLWVVWRRWYRRREAIRTLSAGTVGAEPAPQAARDHRFVGARTLAAAAVLLLIGGAASLGMTLAVPPPAERSVLRTTIEQPFDPRDYVSPLAGFRRHLQEGSAEEILFTVDGLPTGARIRLATLDTYDGVVYAVGTADADTASGTFTRVPNRVAQAAGDGTPVDLSLTVQGYRGVWVPTAGSLVAVDFTGRGAADRTLYVNEVTGTAAVVPGLEEGAAYRLSAVLPDQPTEEQLAEATPGAASVPRTVPLPEALADRLDAYLAGSASAPGSQLSAMLAGLARDGYISHGLSPEEPPSRSGHSLDRLSELFTDPIMIGDAEQYSVAAALLARELGFPARVVFGFAPDPTDAARVAVRGSDVAAWIEVNTAEHGWVALDPTPAERQIPDALPEEPTPISRPQTVVPPNLAEQEQRDDAPPSETSQDDAPVPDPLLELLFTVLRVLGWTILVLALVTSPFLLIVGAKLRRRELRRTSGTPRDRIRGGWDEFQDAALDRGIDAPPSPTRSQFAEVVGGKRPRLLAVVADRAVFSPDDPADADADRVWLAVEELRKTLDSRRTRWERVRAAVSLRSLRGYSLRNLLPRRNGEP